MFGRHKAIIEMNSTIWPLNPAVRQEFYMEEHLRQNGLFYQAGSLNSREI